MKAIIVGMMLALLGITGCGSLAYTGLIGGPSLAQQRPADVPKPTFRF
jgi:hypothetical protein